MRDILIFAAIFGLIPWMLKRPAIGALVFMWLSIMNPHRLAYGRAQALFVHTCHDFAFDICSLDDLNVVFCSVAGNCVERMEPGQ